MSEHVPTHKLGIELDRRCEENNCPFYWCWEQADLRAHQCTALRSAETGKYLRLPEAWDYEEAPECCPLRTAPITVLAATPGA